jgi:hypothetical protein
LARHKALAPAIRRPLVLLELRKAIFISQKIYKKSLSLIEKGFIFELFYFLSKLYTPSSFTLFDEQNIDYEDV